MHIKSSLRATAPVFHPSPHTSTPTNTTGTHSGPPTPYITPVEPYQAHPVTYIQIGPYQHVPLYIYHQVRGIYIGSRFQPQQEQYFYSHVPPPPPQAPISPASAGYEWWPGEEGEGAWVGSESGGSGFKNGYGGGYGYGGQEGRKFKNFKQGYGKKGGKYKKSWGFKGKKKGERFADDRVALVGRDSAVFG